jgi:hypothetical protein
MQAIRYAVTASLLGLLAGCAALPRATVKYPLAESRISVKVIRTVACDTGDNFVVVNSTTPTVKHVAAERLTEALDLSALRGTFSDTDIKFNFYDDGRLKDINATTVGQGEAIFKTVMTIAKSAAGLLEVRKTFAAECAWLKAVANGKPLTLTYEGGVDLGNMAQQVIPADTASLVYDKTLAPLIGNVCTIVERGKAPDVPVLAASTDRFVLLTVRQPGSAKLTVRAGRNDTACDGADIWSGDIAVAQFGTRYGIPIPAAALFGKQVFAASFAESGALTSLQYASNTGAGQLANVINTGLTTFQGDSAAQKAANLKAEADLIVQQQRLTQCLADGSSCK